MPLLPARRRGWGRVAPRSPTSCACRPRLTLRITVRIWKNALPVALPRFGPIYFSLPANAIPDSYMSSTSFQLALLWFSTNGLVYYSFKGYIFIMDYVNHICSSFED